MNKFNVILIIIFTVAVIYGAITLEIMYFPCAAALPGGLFLFIGYKLEYANHSWGWNHVFGCLGILMSMMWIVTLIFCQLKVIKNGDGTIEVVKPLYPFIGWSLAKGVSIDSVRLKYSYRNEKSNYSVASSDYLLLKKEDSTVVVFGSFNKILEGKNPSFEQRDLGHGLLNVCTFRSSDGTIKTFDLTGKDVSSSGYEPPIINCDHDEAYNSPL